MHQLPHKEGGIFKMSTATGSGSYDWLLGYWFRHWCFHFLKGSLRCQQPQGLVAMTGFLGTGLGIGAFTFWKGTQWLQYCDTSLAMPSQCENSFNCDKILSVPWWLDWFWRKWEGSTHVYKAKSPVVYRVAYNICEGNQVQIPVFGGGTIDWSWSIMYRW